VSDRDPDQTVCLQVKVGATVVYNHIAYGDRATLQVPGRDADGLLATGDVYEIDPDDVPDVATVSADPPPTVSAVKPASPVKRAERRKRS
jgi:hypothetical protein